MRKKVKGWWKQAKRDLITAENCKNSEDYYACAFFCQQSVEKGLKALYIAKKRMSPVTNALVDLPRHRDGYAIKILHVLKAIDRQSSLPRGIRMRLMERLMNFRRRIS